MARCRYCGENAGWFRNSHKHCEQEHTRGVAAIERLVGRSLRCTMSVSALAEAVEAAAREGRVGTQAQYEATLKGYGEAVEQAFDDGVLSREEEARLKAVSSALDMSPVEVERTGIEQRIVRGALLRDLLDGNPRDRRREYGLLPFNLQKTEKLIHVFEDTEYYERKTRTHYAGGSQGVSVRIARGVYYRVGGFKGERYQTEETVHEDNGLMGFTDRHLYFAGDLRRFRIRWDRIVAFDPYADGIGVQRDAQSAKPQAFVTGDGWFTYNLAVNLSQA